MSKACLPTYLRTHRKRAGLSQDEVAFLIGAQCGPTVSRHEAGDRTVWLADALAYEALFGAPASALFAGEYRRSSALVEKRAMFLLSKLEREGTDTPADRQKCLFLEAVLQSARSSLPEHL
jgi:transcriptional regulator with XRE-family HTH domain